MSDLADGLKETLYTVVGFGVLGVQQAQVRRRDLQRDLAKLAVEVDEKLDPLLDDVEARLPEDLRAFVAQGRSAARSLQRSLLGATPG